MNIVKTGQVPIADLMKYVADGNKHYREVLRRRDSNCRNAHTWVTATSPRPETFYVKHTSARRKPEKETVFNLNQISRNVHIDEIKSGVVSKLRLLSQMDLIDDEISEMKVSSPKTHQAKGGNITSFATSRNQSNFHQGSIHENQAERALRLSECTTPDIFSEQDESSDKEVDDSANMSVDEAMEKQEQAGK
jgi:hypothetical protein